MNAHDDSNDAAGSVGDVLQRAFVDEPPLTLNLQSIAQRGTRRLRRRRAAAIGGAMLAVATLTAGVAIGVPQFGTSIGAASSTAKRVPGCAAVLETDDPAVTAWREGLTAAPTPSSSSPNTRPASSSSVAAATEGTPDSAAATGPVDSYGEPVPAWLTAAKAADMAAAFYAAIPPGAHLSAAPSSAQGGPLPFTAGGGVTGGGGILTAGSVRAFLTVQVQFGDRGAPPCTANLALRLTSDDGSITDVIDEPGTSETGHYMLAESFRPDGTLVNVGLNNSGGIAPRPRRCRSPSSK